MDSVMTSVSIRRAQRGDGDKLLPLQQRAFREDVERYRDHETNPASEPMERLLHKISNFVYYVIRLGDQIVGGLDIRDRGEGHYYLNRIYVDPECQSAGIGSQVMRLMEAQFPDARVWTLSTPHLAVRNHHFYEKFGYQKVGETVKSEWLTLYDYRKQVD